MARPRPSSLAASDNIVLQIECVCNTAPVDLDDLSRCQQSLVHAAARYGEPQRLTADDGAEVAARAERPSAAIAEACDLGELRRELGGGGHSQGRSSNTAPPSSAGQRGVSETPWTVSSKPRSLLATVVIGCRHVSETFGTRSVTSRASDSSGANSAFLGNSSVFQE